MTDIEPDERTQAEIEVLERFGLRWSILAAWLEELHKRQVELNPDLAERLEAVRVKLCAGCYSSCEIGCDLGEIEGILVARDAESPAESVDFWLELLGQAMAEDPESDRVLRYPAVKFHYLNCGFAPCRCRSFEE